MDKFNRSLNQCPDYQHARHDTSETTGETEKATDEKSGADLDKVLLQKTIFVGCLNKL